MLSQQHSVTYTLLLLSILNTQSFSIPASSFFTSYSSHINNWPTPSFHIPNFYVSRENITLIGSKGLYNLLVYAIRDASPPSSGGIIAAYIPAASENLEGKQGTTPELNLLVPLPSMAPANLPPLPRYGWAWLYGAKVVTIPWLDCCNITGDTNGYSFSEDYRSEWTLTQFQNWYPNGTHKGRDAQSLHTFTLRYDTVVGYRIDITTSLVINEAAAPKTVEFINFLTPQLANPWPFPASHDFLPNPRSSITAWSSDIGITWKDFAENILSGAMLHTYNISNPIINSSTLGAVVMASNNGWSAALAFSGDGLTFLQATCPTWMDQHQIVMLPSPGPDGFIALSPTFSLAYLPSLASNDILSRVNLITHQGDNTRGNGSAVLLRLGVVEDFETQPIELTIPLRALAQVWSSPDFRLVKLDNGTALSIQTLTPVDASNFYSFANSVPLVPLNVSTRYQFQALALAPSRLLCPSGFEGIAQIAIGIYEDDDFNTPFRFIWYNSTKVTGDQGWTSLVVSFTSPSWPSYADIRFISIGGEDDKNKCSVGASALFDNIYFGNSF